ncbi:MAG: UDP-glucose--hexose-1-phosphate uridylyltransferase [Christensenellales bacterium]|nr:UDP-glucose--hexose-1-phosphate uridylyltransferase [Christensenellales bacterium]
MITVTEYLSRLVEFARAKDLIHPIDSAYTLNRLLEIMGMDAPEPIDLTPCPIPETATEFLSGLCDHACATELITDSAESRDLFSARLMGVLTPSPAEIRSRFQRLYTEEGPVAATADFYQLCRDADYIRVDRIAKNTRFLQDTPAGKLEITINLSKPEKDPRDIAAQRSARQAGYPKCMLCVENPGYAGRIGFPARQNHRMIPLTLNGTLWYMQYSPYLYYNEHCIVLNAQHVPMQISRETFERLCDFVDLFPHYMLGSNADLPIVGGSILSHDHFQGGNYRFPMDNAPVRIPLNSPDACVEACVADWPMTCIVLRSSDRAALIAQADRILQAWREYSDTRCGILSHTGETPHNTITPILRMEDGRYKLSLVLRNNRTSDEHPLGIYHPHADLHHIKKENIGLIEVMGLFILPGRLQSELSQLREFLTGARDLGQCPDESDPLAKHFDWIRQIAEKTGVHLTPEAASEAIRRGLGEKCARVLADSGVFKQTPEGDAGILRFLDTLGYTPSDRHLS